MQHFRINRLLTDSRNRNDDWMRKLAFAVIEQAVRDATTPEKFKCSYGSSKGNMHHNYDRDTARQFLANSSMLKLYCEILDADVRVITEATYKLLDSYDEDPTNFKKQQKKHIRMHVRE